MIVDLKKPGRESLEVDALLVPGFRDSEAERVLTGLLEPSLTYAISQLRKRGEWKGDRGEVQSILCQVGKENRRIVLFGLGERKHADLGVLRQTILKVIWQLRQFGGKRLGIVADDLADDKLTIQSLVEGVLLGAFDPKLYGSGKRSRFLPERLTLIRREPVEEGLLNQITTRAGILADAVNLARALTNEPGNRLGPVAFAERARKLATEAGIEIEIFDEKKIQKLKMNAVLAVASGSSIPARFLVITHWKDPDKQRSPIVLVGKGVTFDSGGISIKPSKGMEEMKMDKAGACSVFAAMIAISKLELPQNVVGLVPLVENLPGNEAQRPGDVIRSLSGKTIEVLNTDAEGRLILADAIAYARQRFAPRVIIDLATLTGACVVALGKFRAGLFSNNEDTTRDFLSAAHRSGERYWQLPLDSEYRKELESSIADIKNIGGRWGGAITAAKFLEEFVEDVPWCHVDMAGMDLFPLEDADLGPSGFGVLTLAEFVNGAGYN